MQQYQIVANIWGVSHYCALWFFYSLYVKQCYICPQMYILQVCSVVFANWVHKRHLLEFININSTINLEGFTRSGEWDLSNGNTFDDTMRDPVHGDIQRVGFTLHLKRIPNYFIFNINIPITMLMLISAVAYILPPEAGEKIGLQITLLLAFSVMLLVISDNTPKVGTTTPILSELSLSHIKEKMM